MRIQAVLLCITVSATGCFVIQGPAATKCREGQTLVASGGDWVCGEATGLLPLPPTCANKQVLTYTEAGWSCVNADAARLEGHPATDFLPAGATAVDSNALGGVPATSLVEDGKIASEALPRGPNGVATLDASGKLPVAALPPAVIPPGTIMAFAGATPPEGWALCDGLSAVRDDPLYEALFGAIGTAHGAADAGHFNLPDLRGRFLRGVDDATGRDPDSFARTAQHPGGSAGPGLGSLQASQVGRHVHRIPTIRQGGTRQKGVFDDMTTASTLEEYGGRILATGEPLADINVSESMASSTDTRPMNVAVHWVIKL